MNSQKIPIIKVKGQIGRNISIKIFKKLHQNISVPLKWDELNN